MKNKMLTSIFLGVISLSSHAFINSGSNAISVGAPPVGSPPVLPVAPVSPVINPAQDVTLAGNDAAIAVAQPAHLVGAIKHNLMDINPLPASLVNLSSGSSATAPCSANTIECKIQTRRAAALAATGKNKNITQLDAMKNGTDSCSAGGAFQAHGTTSNLAYKNCLDDLAVATLGTASTAVAVSPVSTTTITAAPSSTTLSSTMFVESTKITSGITTLEYSGTTNTKSWSGND